MTYKEKWIADHPGEEFDPYNVSCPFLIGYEAAPEDTRFCPHKGISCVQCWNREIPTLKVGLEACSNAAKKLAEGLKKSSEAFAAMTSIKDSGDRTEFATGAVRDMREGKGRCDLMPLEVVAKFMCYDDAILTPVPLNRNLIIHYISEFKHDGDTLDLYRALVAFKNSSQWSDKYTMLLEVAKHFEEGAKKYGENNWQKGIPVHCYIDSAIRHYLKWLRGDTDEPHDRAFVWNIMCCIWEVDYHEKENKEDSNG